MITIGSLFSGIGGLELGLEWAGLGPVLWQVEIDPFCRDKLARHWPNVKRFEDVTKVGSAVFAPVDLICGGFPCQDVSSAGKGAGLAGSRSGLWFEFARIVSELRPSWVVVENVASSAKRWVDAAVAGLEQLDYETLPFPVSAQDVGAPHMRRRIFVIGHTDSTGFKREDVSQPEGRLDTPEPSRADNVTDAERVELREQQGRRSWPSGKGSAEPGDVGTQRNVADSASTGLSRAVRVGAPEATEIGARCAWSKDTMPEPALCRVDDGPTAWVDRNKRLRTLGNAVVPQCAEVIGHVIKELEAACTT